tara:strand:+ start:442 stop:861 length:420 start_codon:yes stop_codon:yes gene_type:complete
MAVNGLINGGNPQQPQIDIGNLYVDWLRGNPHVDPQSTDIQEAFGAGADAAMRAGEFEESIVPRPAEPTPPHHPSDIDPLAGQATPGFTSGTKYNPNLPAYNLPPTQPSFKQPDMGYEQWGADDVDMTEFGIPRGSPRG